MGGRQQWAGTQQLRRWAWRAECKSSACFRGGRQRATAQPSKTARCRKTGRHILPSGLQPPQHSQQPPQHSQASRLSARPPTHRCCGPRWQCLRAPRRCRPWRSGPQCPDPPAQGTCSARRSRCSRTSTGRTGGCGWVAAAGQGQGVEGGALVLRRGKGRAAGKHRRQGPDARFICTAADLVVLCVVDGHGGGVHKRLQGGRGDGAGR